mmetsp:Transcript_109/g.264  ORF Transcript_109/g.264 Transcript_109/m.264 type:complete len:235 (-) Transcript_109:123-827(-)
MGRWAIARGVHAEGHVHPGERGGRGHRSRQQERVPRLQREAAEGVASQGVQRLSVQREERADASEEGFVQDHFPERLDEHVLLPPSLRLRAERGGVSVQHGGRESAGNDQRRDSKAGPRARDQGGSGSRRRVQVSDEAALLRQGRLHRRGREWLVLGGARDGLHSLDQDGRARGSEPQSRGGGRLEVRHASGAQGDDGRQGPVMVAVVPNYRKGVPPHVVGKLGRGALHLQVRG